MIRESRSEARRVSNPSLGRNYIPMQFRMTPMAEAKLTASVRAASMLILSDGVSAGYVKRITSLTIQFRTHPMMVPTFRLGNFA
jgi:hypothetical protein